MGAEDFLVRLSTSSSPEIVEGALLSLVGVSRDSQHPGLQHDKHLRMEDSQHIIEMEVAAAASGATLSVRFALCQSGTIDEVFASLILALATQLRAHVKVAEDVAPEETEPGWQFPGASGEELRRCLVESIPKKRQLWHIDFGEENARLTCQDALARFVIGRDREG